MFVVASGKYILQKILCLLLRSELSSHPFQYVSFTVHAVDCLHLVPKWKLVSKEEADFWELLVSALDLSLFTSGDEA